MYSTQDILGARFYLFQILQSIFGTPPSQTQHDALLDKSTDEAFAVMFETEPEAYDVWRRFRNHNETKGFDPSLENQYTKIFLGPSTLVAPPWESVNTTAKALLMQPSTLDVRKTYGSWGFVSKGYPHEADDHIAIELDFAGKLALALYEKISEGDFLGAHKALDCSRSFIDKHLLNWVNIYVTKLQSAGSEFYASAGQLLQAFLSVDRTLLDSTSLNQLLENMPESSISA